MITDIALSIISIYCVFKIWQILIGGISINIELKNRENNDSKTTPATPVDDESDSIVGTTTWERLEPPPPSPPPITQDATSSAQIPEEKLDEAFTHNEFTPDGDYDDITTEDLESENESLAQMELDPSQQAQGVSFGELGDAVEIAKKRNPTRSEKIRSAEVFAKIEDSDLDHQLRCGDKALNAHITRLLNDRIAHYNKLQRIGTTIEKPDGVDNFSISDFV